MFVLIPLAAGLIAFLSTYFYPLIQIYCSKSARIEYENVVNLPDQVIGSTVYAPFQVKNSGSSELVLNQFTTSCWCVGVAEEHEGTYTSVRVVRIPPSTTKCLYLTYSAKATSESKQTSTVKFHTNDPKNPTCAITISHGIKYIWICHPKDLSFSNVPNHISHTQVIEIHSTDPHAILEDTEFIYETTDAIFETLYQQHLSTSNRQVFHVTLLPQFQPIQRRVNFQVQSRTNPSLNVSIPIQIDTLPTFQLSSTSILLPRNVAGAKIYTSDILCRNTREQAFTLRVQEAEAGLAAEILPGDTPHEQKIRVSWNRENPEQPTKPSKRLLRLLGNDGTTDYPLEVTVLCLPPQP
jgi:hypothetical protein